MRLQRQSGGVPAVQSHSCSRLNGSGVEATREAERLAQGSSHRFVRSCGAPATSRGNR
jgi:hypothetical protein